MRWRYGLAMGLLWQASWAMANNEAGVALLEKATLAAQQTTYQGSYVLHADAQLTALQIMHHWSPEGVLEKRSSLEGETWEAWRDGHLIRLFAPHHAGKMAAHTALARPYPNIFTGEPKHILNHYRLQRLHLDRAAGQNCLWWALVPIEPNRFVRHVCFQPDSGMVMKTQVLDVDGKVLERLMFTAFSRQVPPPNTWPKPAFPEQRRFVEPPTTNNNVATTDILTLPAGFYLLKDRSRTFPDGRQAVRHLTFSDGLARFSVFIEPVQPQMRPVKMEGQGATRLYIRQRDGTRVTVVGDLPDNALRDIAESVSAKR